MPEAETLSSRDRILRARARALASVAAATPVARMELLVFELAQEAYGLELDYVREVCPLRELVPVPCTPRFVLGIINLRGEIFPVIDLRRLFGLPERGLTNATRAIVLRDGMREFGVLADVVAGMRTVDGNTLRAPPAMQGGVHAMFLRGLAETDAKADLIVLDARQILAHPSMVVRENVSALP
jgi:purine-binding chemotaxis protein CheW